MKKLVLLGCCLFCGFYVTAQQRTISGKVTDETGVPLLGVSVVSKGSSVGTATDADGNYSITLSGDQPILVFSFVGFSTSEIPAGDRSVVDVQLTPDVEALKEVVVVAYGTQNRQEVTGAISSVSAEGLKDMPVNSVVQKMQGKLPGVQINHSSGRPDGGGLDFRIRGQASINAGNTPLIVIDGFPTLTSLEAVSPDEVESISVLKDASASSLYGSRAANGVILITTKQAKKGQKNIQFSTYYGVDVVPENKRPDLMNAREFAQYKKEYYEDAAAYEGYTDGVPERYQNPSQYDENSGTDWYDVLLRDALTQNYNLSLSSGVNDLKSSVNLNYNRREGVVLNTYTERFSGRANNIYNASDKLTFGLNLSLAYRTGQVTPSLEDGRNIIASAFLMDPTLEYQNDDGSYPISFSSPGMFPNPNWYLVTTQRVNPEKQVNTLANIFGELELIDGLKYRASGNLDLASFTNRMFEPSTARGAMSSAPPQPAIGSYGTENNLSWLAENTLTYRKTINEQHNFDALIGISAQRATMENSGIEASQYPDDEIEWINAAVTRIGTAGTSEWSMLSYIARLNYNFKEKYLLSLAFRRDGSSRFGADAKWANFPSVSAGWVASEEDFMKGVDALSWLKLRASYGIVGNNNIGNYNHLATVGNADYNLGGQVVAGRALTGIGNRGLTWESTNQFDFGLDLGLFNDRIFLVYDYYHKRTEGLLYGIDIPAQSGFTSITSNIGQFNFWGHEFALETRNFTGDFSWNTSLNISFNRNEAVKLGTSDTPIGGYESSGSDINRTAVGHPLGMFFGWIYDGVYMTQEEFDSQPTHERSVVGGARFRDVSGPDGVPDGIIDDLDKTFIGNPNPDFLYGITNVFRYKNFDASITLAGSVGGDINDGTREWTENLDGVFNVRKEIAERWRSLDNPGKGNIARTRSGSTSLSRWHISRFVFDGSYLSAKNITLGYTLPVKLVDYIKQARIYVSVQNAFMITNYPGLNPEVSASGLDGLAVGRDLSSYPVPRTFTMGLNVNF